MRVAQVLVASLALGVSAHAAFVQRCLTSDTLTTPTKAPLTFCPEYSEASCCTQEEDEQLQNDFATGYDSIFGTCPGCRENYRLMMCGLYCAPNQARYVENIQRNNAERITAGTFRVCPELCNYFHSSCSNTSKVQEYSAGPSSFCAASMDTNRGITMQLTHFDCFVASTTNTCGGDFHIEPRPVEVSNMWMVIGMIVVAVAAIAGIAAVVTMFISKPPAPGTEPAPVESDGEMLLGQDSAEPGGSATV